MFGIPDERLGEEVAVAIHLVDGATLTADELRAFLSKKIAAFMIPSRIVIVRRPAAAQPRRQVPEARDASGPRVVGHRRPDRRR